MDYQFNNDIQQAFESVDFLSDDFDNYGFDEGVENNLDDDSYLSAAIKELDDSLGVIEFHQ